MDALDVRILRTMGTVPYGPHPKDPDAFKTSRIARRVDTTPRTVRSRRRAMEENGVIAGYQVLPNLAHLGLTAEGHFFDVVDHADKDEAIDAALELPRMLAVHEFMGEGVCFEFAFADPDERTETVETLSTLTGDPDPNRFYDGVMPEVDRDLTNLDWRILASLRWEATKRLREVAEEVGVSRRTVKRHYDRMAQEGSFVPVTLMNPSRATGLLLFELLFFLEPDPDPDAAAFLMDELADLVPAIAEATPVRTYAGIRPLIVDDAAADPNEISRDFRVFDHAERDGVAGLTTVVGGKLTTHRLMAERVADRVSDRLGVETPCRTARERLVDVGDGRSWADELARYGIDERVETAPW
jgi:DNA-binding Lrp family transcriptional regulator